MIEAILAYEKFSRTLLNSFESILYHLSINSNKGYPTDLISLPEVKFAASNIYIQYHETLTRLVKVKEDTAFQETFGRFSEPANKETFLELIFSHHHDVQKRKPPFGKKPWVNVYSKTWSLNPTYNRKRSLVSDDPNEYVYMYRTNSLLSFLKDLNKLNVQGVQ